jgi:hypothetical protein
MTLVGGVGSIGHNNVWNVKVSGIIYPSFERVISTVQHLNLPLPSLFLRGLPDIFRSSSARDNPAFVPALVPSEDLFRRGRMQIRP